jgi:holo-[acyl-carrier protein] synthase
MERRSEKHMEAVESNPALVCGVDVIELERFARILKVGGGQFLRRVYTQAEQTLCADRLPQLAVRFAAKEALVKALGTGIRGIGWNEIEILVDQNGCPFVSLYEHAAARAEQMQLSIWAVSLSHSPHLAIAFVVASRPGMYST